MTRTLVLGRFDSEPPRADVQRNDYGVVTAFGYTF